MPSLVAPPARRTSGLTPTEWRDLGRAQWALLAAQVALWTRRRGALAEIAGRMECVEASGVPATHGGGVVGALRGRRPSDDPARHAVVARLGRAVTRAARHGVFRPQCLARSIALSRLLARAGVVDAEVRVGVRRDGGRLAAHAWVEWRGLVVGDTPANVSGYVPLMDVRVLDRAGSPPAP